MKRVFEATNPFLVKAGFRVDRKITDSFARTGLLELSRPGEILVVNYQRPDGNPQLVAEAMSDDAGYLILACVDLAPTNDVLGQIQDFATQIQKYCHDVRPLRDGSA